MFMCEGDGQQKGDLTIEPKGVLSPDPWFHVDFHMAKDEDRPWKLHRC